MNFEKLLGYLTSKNNLQHLQSVLIVLKFVHPCLLL